jgi:hypothetical protein
MNAEQKGRLREYRNSHSIYLPLVVCKRGMGVDDVQCDVHPAPRARTIMTVMSLGT